MLNVGDSLLSIFNDNFSAECAVRSPSKNVAAMPEGSESAISLCERIVAKIN